MHEHALSERVKALSGENAFQVLAAANKLEAKGKRIIHFEIGEPDFPTPRHIVEAGKKALDDGQTKYCPSQGLPVLREAIVEYTAKYKGITARPDEVVVAPGGKPIIFYTICALVNPGDEVLYPNPGFPTYESVIKYAGGIPVPLVLEEKNGFRLRVDELKAKITPKTRLLIINSPSNPTGGLLTDGDLKEIAAAVIKAGIFVLSDEVYSRISFAGSPTSIASLPGMKDRTVILDGFSKTWCMTGWRLGYGIMPVELAQKETLLLNNSSSCTPPFIQTAGLAALTGPQDSTDMMVKEFIRRRDVIVDGLNAIPGVHCLKPDGAFYVFPSVAGTGIPSAEIASYLLNESGVALLDGASFGASGTGFLRLSYATSLPLINEGLEKITAGMKAMMSKR
jgi:aspartate aminotransferase